MNGIVKFNPDLIQNPESSKQIVIDDVLINDSVHLKLENQTFLKSIVKLHLSALIFLHPISEMQPI
jgi:hypothetical protein